MDTARQFLRYSIPGSIFLLTLISLQVALDLATGASVSDATKNVSSAFVIAVLAAGIPVGFILYQLYYGAYRPFAWSRWPRPMPRKDRGAEVLRALTCRQRYTLFKAIGQPFDHREAFQPRTGRLLSIRPLRLLTDWEDTFCPDQPCMCRDIYPRYPVTGSPTNFRLRWRRNWDVVMTIADMRGNDSRYIAVKREYTSLSDIYHALGVCRVSIGVAFLAWVTYNWVHNSQTTGQHAAQCMIVAASAAAITAALIVFLSSARKQTQEALLTRLGLSLIALLPQS